MKKVLFIDRDGTILVEPPVDFQVDSLEKMSFLPGAIGYLSKIAKNLDYSLVMVSNQDGLGTPSFPMEDFIGPQEKMLQILAGEEIHFDAIHIDPSLPEEQSPNRKPGTGMLQAYMDKKTYDLPHSLVIGDRLTDIALAKNLGCTCLYLGQEAVPEELQSALALSCKNWEDIYQFLSKPKRQVKHRRNTKETQIQIELNLDGSGDSSIHTGLPFFDHMLDQVAKHGQVDLNIEAKGDLHIDEHHTIEDVGIALGEAFALALGDKRGIQRYGYLLPMDDCLAQVGLDFGGRSWLVWKAEFKREKIGDMPTEMFSHFFKSFADAAKANLNIQAEGENEHHKIEAIFKAFAKSIKMAIARDEKNPNSLPSTKGML